jgi:hypothetical protein
VDIHRRDARVLVEVTKSPSPFQSMKKRTYSWLPRLHVSPRKPKGSLRRRLHHPRRGWAAARRSRAQEPRHPRHEALPRHPRLPAPTARRTPARRDRHRSPLQRAVQLEHVNGNWLADQLTRLQVRYPSSRSSSPTHAAAQKTGPTASSPPRTRTQRSRPDAAAEANSRFPTLHDRAAVLNAHRRPRLRRRQVPPRATATRDPSRDRPPPNRARLRARPRSLGRRAHVRLVASLQATARLLRPPSRNPPSVPRPRLLSCLLQTTPAFIVIRVLSPMSSISCTRPTS